jgi:hypothetical protein
MPCSTFAPPVLVNAVAGWSHDCPGSPVLAECGQVVRTIPVIRRGTTWQALTLSAAIPSARRLAIGYFIARQGQRIDVDVIDTAGSEHLPILVALHPRQ